MGDIEFLIAVLFAAAVLVRLADLVSIPYPIALVAGGVAIGFVPGLPDVELAPEAVFLVFLPPLLHAAAVNASPPQLRAAAAQLLSLTVALVLVTMAVVAVVAHAAIDGLSWQAAFVLGAILSPTDPVSAAAVFSRMGVPERVALPVEGEAMLNDAAALVAYKVAVTATVSGTFALSSALGEFAVSVAGGVAFGLAVGWIGVRVQRRLADVPLAIFLSVLFAYGAYIGAEELGAAAEALGVGWVHPSGVLATVTAGVWFGWHSHEMFDADTRLSGLAFWQVLVFGLNATLFVLLGLQLESLYTRLGATGPLLADVVVVSLVVIGVRLAWLLAPLLLARVRPRAGAGPTAARARGGRLERHARRDLARRRARAASGARLRRAVRAARRPDLRDGRRHRDHARRPGPDAAAAAEAARPRRRARVEPG